MLQEGLATLLHLSYFCYLLPVMNYLIIQLSITDNFSACIEYLAENHLPFPSVLVGFDTLTYRKDYDRSPILVVISCLQIKSHHLVSIGICFIGEELIIKDAPSLQRLLLHYRYAPSQITVVSAPRLETLGVIRDPFKGYKMVVGSTLIQVLYITMNTFVIIRCIHLCA